MQQIKFNYSLKNIGLTSKDVYTRSLINKTLSVIQRMRWKAHFFLNQANNDTDQDRAANRPTGSQIRSDEGLTLETSAFRISVQWPIYIINSVDKTKFLYTTSPPTQHHSFFRNNPF